MTLHSVAFYGGAILLGLLLGAVLIIVWRRCLPKSWARRFWSTFATTARSLMTVDEGRAFARLYGRLGISVARYVGRNTAGLVLGCLPTLVVVVLAFPVALESWGRHAPGIAAVPAEAQLTVAGTPYQGQGAIDGPAVVEAGGQQVTIADPVAPNALCWSDGWCLVFELLAFQVQRVGEAVLPDSSYIAVRPSYDDGNPLWPFLSDLEFAFWLAFLAGTTGTFLLQGRSK